MNQGTSTILMLVVLFAIMYFLMIRPENKRKKKAAGGCSDSLKKGDVITTIGGIVGKIVQVNNETIVIETSDDRVRMELTKWAVSTVGVQTGEQPAADKDDKKKKEKEESAVEVSAKEEEPAEEPVDEIPAPEEEN